jgi:hypothetical protein
MTTADDRVVFSSYGDKNESPTSMERNTEKRPAALPHPLDPFAGMGTPFSIVMLVTCFLRFSAFATAHKPRPFDEPRG